jgi:hypothetical protein
MGFTGWVLDSTRNKYYYHDPDKNSYVYADGTEIALGISDGGYAQEPQHTMTTRLTTLTQTRAK